MRIAVAGSGISGLVAAHLLSADHEVTLFEADSRLGGHTHTVDADLPDGRFPVDTGFIVFNDRTYPGFCKLMDRLGVASQPSEMSFSVRCERTGLEYNGTSWNTLFAQRRNLLRPSFLRMLKDIVRFHAEAKLLLADGAELSFGEWLGRSKWSREFREHYLFPMCAAIWSGSLDDVARFPARSFARFFENHGMLSVDDRPQWRTLRGGSRSYIPKLIAPFAGRVRLDSPVTRIVRHADRVEVTARGATEAFDHVVVAAHADQALRMLADPGDAEREILSAIPYRRNDTVLHTDASVLPRRKLARAAWNFHLLRERSPDPTVTYDMNRLQSIPSRESLLVTLNRTADLDPARILGRFEYEHPCYSTAAVAAQARRDEIQGVRRTWYCGAYWGWGFHEDGLQSALHVTRRFGRDL